MEWSTRGPFPLAALGTRPSHLFHKACDDSALGRLERRYKRHRDQNPENGWYTYFKMVIGFDPQPFLPRKHSSARRGLT